MTVEEISRGDILVTKYNDVEQNQFERDYIIFIASGSKLSITSGKGYICYLIPVIAAIDLSNTLEIETKTNLSVGYAIFYKEKCKTTTIRKPSFSEMTELINRLKENGYIYNRKCVKICRA